MGFAAAGPRSSRRAPRRPLVLLLQLRARTAHSLAGSAAAAPGG